MKRIILFMAGVFTLLVLFFGTSCQKDINSINNTYSGLYEIAIEFNNRLNDCVKENYILISHPELVATPDFGDQVVPEWMQPYVSDWEEHSILDGFNLEDNLLSISADSHLTVNQKEILARLCSLRDYLSRLNTLIGKHCELNTRSSSLNSASVGFELSSISPSFFDPLYLKDRSIQTILTRSMDDPIDSVFCDSCADDTLLAYDNHIDSLLNAHYQNCLDGCSSTANGGLLVAFSSNVLLALFEGGATPLEAAVLFVVEAIGISWDFFNCVQKCMHDLAFAEAILNNLNH